MKEAAERDAVRVPGLLVGEKGAAGDLGQADVTRAIEEFDGAAALEWYLLF